MWPRQLKSLISSVINTKTYLLDMFDFCKQQTFRVGKLNRGIPYWWLIIVHCVGFYVWRLQKRLKKKKLKCNVILNLVFLLNSIIYRMDDIVSFSAFMNGYSRAEMIKQLQMFDSLLCIIENL